LYGLAPPRSGQLEVTPTFMWRHVEANVTVSMTIVMWSCSRTVKWHIFRIHIHIASPSSWSNVPRVFLCCTGNRNPGRSVEWCIYTAQGVDPYSHLGYITKTGFGKCNDQSATTGRCLWMGIEHDFGQPIGAYIDHSRRPLLFTWGSYLFKDHCHLARLLASKMQVLRRYLAVSIPD
jgi:hypothetical protein